MRIKIITSLIAIILTTASIARSQSLRIVGSIINGKDFLDDVTLIITDTAGTFTNELNLRYCAFDFKLSLNNVFVITFQKNGYITRTVYVNTHCNRVDKYRFEFDIELPLKKSKTMMFTPKIFYDKKSQSFKYDIEKIEQ